MLRVCRYKASSLVALYWLISNSYSIYTSITYIYFIEELIRIRHPQARIIDTVLGRKISCIKKSYILKEKSTKKYNKLV